jgi:transposase-like protein
MWAWPRPRRSGVEFLRSLVRRGLAGVQLVVSDAHQGPQAGHRPGPERPLAAPHGVLLRDALGHCPEALQLVRAAIRPIFRAGSLEETRRLLDGHHRQAAA